MPDLFATREEQTGPASKRVLLEGILLGAAYGLSLRGVIFLQRYIHLGVLPIVMSFGFLFLGPVALGFIVVRRAQSGGVVSVWYWIFAPWIATLLMLAGTALLLWEGAICIVMAAPVSLLGGSIGGVIAGLMARYRKPSRSLTACVVLLPFLISSAESSIVAPNQTRTVESQIRIHASPATVWDNIKRVPRISPAELNTTWDQRIGFPRPVEATLSYEGVGGVRHASFERGVLFVETVNEWQPQHLLAFSIRADRAHIPATTLDEHVTIGGRYFDVLDGKYRIEPAQNGDVILHLVSHQRLSTDFNGYAGLWTDAVMQSLQTNILQVIKHRCESSTGIVQSTYLQRPAR